jgi:hypothetical protein
MTELPDSLVRFERQLERAIERDQRRHPRGLALRFGAGLAVAATAAFGAASLLSDEAPVGGPPAVERAAPHERAAAVLSPARASIVHEVASHRHVSADGSVSRWRDETWRETTPPYARRQVTTRAGGSRAETATVGAGPTQLYDAATDTIYTNPPASGPALGTPEPAAEGDPLRAQLLELLRTRDPRDVSAARHRERRAIRFQLDQAAPDGSAVRWTYLVNAETYEPILLTVGTTGGSLTTTRFDRYEALRATEATKRLLSLRAQHPGAKVDATEAGYRAALARLGGAG